MERDVENLARVLAVLVAEGNYTYVDKIGNAPSKDLLAFYLKEAMRDFHSILRAGKVEKAGDLLERIKNDLKSADVTDFLNRSIENVVNYAKDRKSLREICSMLSAKALAISAKYI